MIYKKLKFTLYYITFNGGTKLYRPRFHSSILAGQVLRSELSEGKPFLLGNVKIG
jgi:hypothetical protein